MQKPFLTKQSPIRITELQKSLNLHDNYRILSVEQRGRNYGVYFVKMTFAQQVKYPKSNDYGKILN